MQEDWELDALDWKLLAALQRDGRLTNQELAEQIGLSPSQCSRRRTRLEEERLITGYHASLDHERLGFGVIAILEVTLARHSPDNATHFRDLIARLAPIQEAYAITGEADYLLKAVLPDLAGLAQMVNKLLAESSIARVHSSVVLERLKETRELGL